MAALTAGTSAPDFKLQTMDGKQFSLREALDARPRGRSILQDFLPGVPIHVPVS